ENARTVADLLHLGITQTALADNWKEVTLEYSVGKLAASSHGAQIMSEAVSLNSYPAFHWREKLVIRHTAKGYFDPVQNERREKMNLGIHLHTILSRIKYSNELHAVVDQIFLEGFIMSDEKEPLVKQIEELFKLPQVAKWFQNDWDVRTEIP